MFSLLLVLLMSACSLPSAEAALPANSAVCLQGNWEMSNSDLNAMLLALIPLSSFSIPAGTFGIRFDGDLFIYYSDGYTLRIAMPDGYMEADVTFQTDGTYAVDGGMLNLSDIVSTNDISAWRAVINGETQEVPGNTSVMVPQPGSGPFTCSATTLTISTVTPSGETYAMLFSRLP
jgi:hypothetical protein